MNKNNLLYFMLLFSGITLGSLSANQTPKDYIENNFSISQGCLFLTTPGEDPFINIFLPDVDTYKVIKLGYIDENNNNAHIKKAEQLKNITVLSETKNIFSANIRIQKKYPGERKALIGEKLANIFFSKDHYEGKILIDEYRENMPMFWILNNIEELRALLSYLQNNLGTLPETKPLLVIKILNDSNTTLIKDYTDFLNKYFYLVDGKDPIIKKFFEKSKKCMTDLGFNMSSPSYKGESVIESIFRQSEGLFKDFDAKKWAILSGTFLISTFIYDDIKDGINYTFERVRNGEKSFTRRLLKKVFEKE